MEATVNQILSKCISPEVPIKCLEYKGIFVPDSYLLIADSIENFQVRDDDTWVCSFPKAGTTWTQEMVWNIGHNLKIEDKRPLSEKFPFIEFTGTTTIGWITKNMPEKGTDFLAHVTKSVEYSANLPSPRFLKTHLPFELLPKQLRTREKKCKIIYVARNPKDVCISYYYHYKLLEAFCSTFDDFCRLFLADKVYYAPFWSHVIGYWKHKNEYDILFLKYEDMKRDLSFAIKKTASYMGKSLQKNQIKPLEEHLSFASMKKNPSTNNEKAAETINESKIFGENYKAELGEFIRKGESGQWKTSMPTEMIKQFDDWTAKQLKNYSDLNDEFKFY